MAALALTPSSKLSSKKHRGSSLAFHGPLLHYPDATLPLMSLQKVPNDSETQRHANMQGLDAHN